MTGFEPATPRPPGVCATRLRHIPKKKIKEKPKLMGLGRGGRIRTCDLRVPNAAR